MAELLEERGEKTSPAEMLRLLSQEKNGMEVVGFPHGLREAYDERMHELGARDLDDLLTEALALDVSRKPVRHRRPRSVHLRLPRRGCGLLRPPAGTSPGAASHPFEGKLPLRALGAGSGSVRH